MKKLLITAIFLINSIISAYDLNTIDNLFSEWRITDIPELAKQLSAKGSIYHAKKEYNVAIDFYKSSLMVREKIGLEKSYGFATVLFLLSIAEDKTGKSCIALTTIDKAIKLYHYLGKLEDIRIAELEIETIHNNCNSLKNKVAIDN